MLRSLPTGSPVGTFRVVRTRDGEAHAHDGQPFYAFTPKGCDADGVRVFEIKFADGRWMLASALDLDPEPK